VLRLLGRPCSSDRRILYRDCSGRSPVICVICIETWMFRKHRVSSKLLISLFCYSLPQKVYRCGVRDVTQLVELHHPKGRCFNTYPQLRPIRFTHQTTVKSCPQPGVWPDRSLEVLLHHTSHISTVYHAFCTSPNDGQPHSSKPRFSTTVDTPAFFRSIFVKGAS
jgi:hypothetical protein